MNLNIEPIKDWFGFSRRERRSNFTLLIIIVVIIGIRYIIPESTIQIEDITSTVLASDIPLNNDSSSKSKKNKPSQSASYYPSTKKIPVLKSRQINYNPKSYQNTSGYQNLKKQIVDINNSDSAGLVMLPGIGPVLSARIIKYRNMLGGFTNTGQLKEVYGLSEETFDLIKDRVTADSTFIKKVNINTAVFKELSHIRYLEKYEITSILKYRELKGSINSVQDLVDNKIITAEKASKVKGYLKFGE